MASRSIFGVSRIREEDSTSTSSRSSLGSFVSNVSRSSKSQSFLERMFSLGGSRKPSNPVAPTSVNPQVSVCQTSSTGAPLPSNAPPQTSALPLGTSAGQSSMTTVQSSNAGVQLPQSEKAHPQSVDPQVNVSSLGAAALPTSTKMTKKDMSSNMVGFPSKQDNLGDQRIKINAMRQTLLRRICPYYKKDFQGPGRIFWSEIIKEVQHFNPLDQEDIDTLLARVKTHVDEQLKLFEKYTESPITIRYEKENMVESLYLSFHNLPVVVHFYADVIGSMGKKDIAMRELFESSQQINHLTLALENIRGPSDILPISPIVSDPDVTDASHSDQGPNTSNRVTGTIKKSSFQPRRQSISKTKPQMCNVDNIVDVPEDPHDFQQSRLAGRKEAVENVRNFLHTDNSHRGTDLNRNQSKRSNGNSSSSSNNGRENHGPKWRYHSQDTRQDRQSNVPFERNNYRNRPFFNRSDQRQESSQNRSPEHVPVHSSPRNNVHFNQRINETFTNSNVRNQGGVTPFGTPAGILRNDTNAGLSSGRHFYTKPNTAHLREDEINRGIICQQPLELIDYSQRDAPDHFYRDMLPEPWNMVPSIRKNNDHFKMISDDLLKFNGCVSSYPTWRNYFITNVHLIEMNLGYKVNLLVRSLSSVERMKNYTRRMNYNALGYQNLIYTLEERYGGAKRMLDTTREELETFPTLPAFNLKTLEEFVDIAHGYVDTMQSHNRLEECTTYSFTALMERKLPAQYETLYNAWLTSTNRPHTGLSILDWCQHFLSTNLKGRGGDILARQYEKQIQLQKSKKPETRFKFLTHDKREESDEDTDDEEITDAVYEAFYSKPSIQALPSKSMPLSEQTCEICKEKHLLKECKEFRNMSVKERGLFIAKSNRCFKCFKKGHGVKTCDKNIVCKECGLGHNSMLHGSYGKRNTQKANVYVTENEVSELENPTMVESLCLSGFKSNSGSQVSLRFAPIILTNGGRKEIVNALLDDGCNKTVMSTDLATKLALTGNKSNISLTGIGGRNLECSTLTVNVQLSSLSGNFKKTISAITIPQPTGKLRACDWNEHKAQWPHIKNLDFPKIRKDKGVDIIIGNDYPTILHSSTDIAGKDDNEPFARYTPLGWTAVGPLSKESNDSSETPSVFLNSVQVRENVGEMGKVFSNWLENYDKDINVLNFHFKTLEDADVQACIPSTHDKDCNNPLHVDMQSQSVEDYDAYTLSEDMRELSQLLKQTLQFERLPGDDLEDEELSVEEKLALECLHSSRKKVGNRYQVGVMWRPDEPNLPNNLKLALRRMFLLECSKHIQTEEDREKYNKVFKSWIEKGYVQIVPTSEIKNDKSYYLPHFPVIRIDKTSTKIRPVLDGKAKYKGKSLNDAVFAGPKLINDLSVVLLRFRARPIAVGGDIAEMFLQVLMEPCDRAFHRFLFRERTSDPLVHYEFLVHPFGNRGSPCVAIFVIKEHAKENAEKFPRAAETVLHSTIVDDNMDSVDTVEEAVQLLKDLKELYSGCGMTIRKFISNKAEVLDHFTEEEKATSIDLSDITTLTSELLPIVKTLGVIWIADSDMFTFSFKSPDSNTVWTKRKAVSVAYSIFDPLGFLAPFIVISKTVVRNIVNLGLDWDDKIPINELSDWINWVSSLPHLEKLRVPRSLKPNPGELRQELHIFVDASSKACAAVAYVTTHYVDSITVRLAMAKTRIAPQKIKSVPRLELIAAYLGVLLAKHVNKAISLPQSAIHFWTDSMNVLCWLRTTTRNLKTFVANRVEKIHQLSILNNWHWVPTDKNPADPASRGVLADKLPDLSIWWNGPEFLYQGIENWPETPEITPGIDAAAEIKICVTADCLTARTDMDKKELNVFDIEYHSTLNKLKRMMSIPIFWLLKSKKQAETRFSPKVFEAISDNLVRRAQKESLSDSFDELDKNGRLLLQNPLFKLEPFVDEAGVMRVGGRLKAAKYLDPKMRSPAILPKNHHLSKLIVRDTHVYQCLHSGGEGLASQFLSMKYWIMGGRNFVNKIVRECVTCRRMKTHIVHQKMAPLPDHRLQEGHERLRAFHTTGIDCAGPFYTMQGRGKPREKRYLLLFTCTQYRAVHTEMIKSLNTESFLLGFSRFLARRPRPQRIISDNGRNFVRGDKEIKELWNTLTDPKIKELYPEFEWVFNTPKCPHSGGVFERMIQSFKVALYAVIGRADVNDEQLGTAFCIVEELLNSRPLSLKSCNAADPRPLTPAHFLGTDPHLDIAPVPKDGRYDSRWHRLQKIMDDVWTRFIRECLCKLHRLPKWNMERRNPEPGDVVALLEQKDRGYWPLARVMDTYKSRDGLVRSLDVLVAGRKMYRRPIHSVIPLISSPSTELPQKKIVRVTEEEGEDEHTGEKE